ncbi:MAG: prepilin-type N-terminal cleavage/methylation domain-containing protein [Nitrospirae bacterium]|nr:prepilin-type N-terminal cleavage/methylation domain-containing protein [Nitrospirota bacterium]
MERFWDDQGFTLLEILVAFFILTVILGLLYESVKSTASLSQRIREKNRTDSNIELAFMKMRQEMISVYINTNDPLTYFIGSPQYSAEDEHDTLLFTTLAQTRLMQNAPVSHLEGIQYIVLPEKNGHGYLLAHEQDTNLFSFGTQAVVADPLLHHIKSFRLLYFDGHQWTNQWNSLQSHLVPLMVKMEISVKRKHEAVKTFTDVFPIPVSTLNQNQNGSGTTSSGLP